MTNTARQPAESAHAKTCTDPISSLYGHLRAPPNRLYRVRSLTYPSLPPDPERPAQWI